MVNPSPLVSVITPTYNSSKFITSTIESVKNQTYHNWEMIIIDDCSRDHTVELVRQEQANDNRIKLIPLKENGGAAMARNTGMKQAKGKYIAFLDSDDLWTEKKLEEQIAFMEDNNFAFSFANYSIMDVDGNAAAKIIYAPRVVTYRSLLRNPGAIGCLTVVINREQIIDHMMPNIKSRQDFALWLKILRSGYKGYGINKTLAQYRKVPGSISSNKIKAAKKNWYVYRQLEQLNTLRSSWYFANYAVRSIKKTFF
ncbi:glycosyltransferase family 2 protein [Aquibacillus koreensis]|uniref:Glycosyltransferase family 2 protein n=1 Tax=Aquibacillus koreensis TaxID=279446 RepID=A0A9X3WK38_9BACI|nr:glycosyltransferase family 2 protein [Aquibacillus koreensis]MCT2535123.1 glycosyltransferase family 2 protein [Aquibacillus koreensis]MDC3419766.1 glycosyltransferase family 2 protein [Aquibacillus koreensis]